MFGFITRAQHEAAITAERRKTERAELQAKQARANTRLVLECRDSLAAQLAAVKPVRGDRGRFVKREAQP